MSASSTRSDEGTRRRGLATVIAASAGSAATAKRDGAMLAGLFLMPVFVMGIVGFAMRGYSDPVFTVGVLDRGPTVASQAFVNALDAESSVRTRAYSDFDTMHSAVYRGRLHAAVVIPPEWNGETTLDLYATAASVGTIVVRAIAAAKVPHANDPSPPVVPSRVPGGKIEGSPPIGFQYTAPSNLVLFLILNGMISSAGMLMLRRQGITRRLLATPAKTWELLLIMVVGPAQVMVVQAIFLIVSAGLAFGVPWGDPLGVLALTTSVVLVGISLSLFMSSVYRSPEQAFSLSPLIGIAAGMLGGLMWPLSVVPVWLRQAGHALPTAWAMDGYLALIFARATFSDILPEIGALLAMALLLGGIGALRLRAEFSR